VSDAIGLFEKTSAFVKFRDRVLAQLHWYVSDDNMATDGYLRGIQKEGGWFDLKHLCTFKLLQSLLVELSQDLTPLTDALGSFPVEQILYEVLIVGLQQASVPVELQVSPILVASRTTTEFRIRRVVPFDRELIVHTKKVKERKWRLPKDVPVGRSTTKEENCVKVSGISAEVREDLLWELMMQAGPVKAIYCPRNHMLSVEPDVFVEELLKQPHRGVAYVQFQHISSVAYASFAFNGLQLYSSRIQVEPHVERSCPEDDARSIDVYDQMFEISCVPPKMDEAAVHERLFPIVQKYSEEASFDSLWSDFPLHVELEASPQPQQHDGKGVSHLKGVLRVRVPSSWDTFRFESGSSEVTNAAECSFAFVNDIKRELANDGVKFFECSYRPLGSAQCQDRTIVVPRRDQYRSQRRGRRKGVPNIVPLNPEQIAALSFLQTNSRPPPSLLSIPDKLPAGALAVGNDGVARHRTDMSY
jgi:RNA recognition motif-containing protein